MWGTLLGLLGSSGGGSSQPQSNGLDVRRQYYQQLLAGQKPAMSYGGARHIGNQNNMGDIMNLMQLLGNLQRSQVQQPMQYQAPQYQFQQPVMRYQQMNPYMNYGNYA